MKNVMKECIKLILIFILGVYSVYSIGIMMNEYKVSFELIIVSSTLLLFTYLCITSYIRSLKNEFRKYKRKSKKVNKEVK